jgi:myo-inositol-1(or 4)-monophosphatase
MASEMDFLRTAEEAARLAGAVLQDWAGRFTVSEKSRANLVTEADVAAQFAIHKHIHTRYPEHNFLGEEELCESNSDSPYRWVIDPLDGTSNYVHQFPYYAVSIGLARGNELQLGVILDPTRDEMFSAVRNCGASLDGAPIRPTRIGELRNAMVVASLPVACGVDDPAVQRFLKIMPHAQSVQRTGSAALNLAYVACGRLDAFWSSSLKPWDMAAGVLIVEEAGGKVTKLDGRRFEVDEPDLLASNGCGIHDELQQLLR